MLTLAKPPAAWRVAAGTVPLVDVQRTANLHPKGVDYAVKTQVIHVTTPSRRGMQRRVTLEDALLIVACAALATAVGVAWVTVLRAVRESGGKLTDAGLTIPLTIAA